MPVETIKCRECGSAEVTEFKPGSYVCGHCEAIFKHVSPAALFGGCELDGCGVPAVGRCSSCNRRFCGTHQARDMSGERPVYLPTGRRVTRDTVAIYVDQCVPCRADQLAREAERERAAVAAERDAGGRALEQIGSMESPFDRLVALVRLLFDDSGYRRAVHPPIGFDSSVLTKVCPEFWPTPPPFDGYELRGSWDGQEVARWFASRAKNTGLSPGTMVIWKTSTWCRTLFGQRLQVDEGPPEPAWAFPEGSGLTYGDRDQQTAYVFPDGRLGAGKPFKDKFGHRIEWESEGVFAKPDHGLRPCVLIDMAELLKLNVRAQPQTTGPSVGARGIVLPD